MEIHIVIGTGIVFRTISLGHYEARPNGNLNGVVLWAHLGYVLQRNNRIGFQIAAKFGFNGCVANLRQTSDGVLVCAHDDGFIGNDSNTYNISEHTYSEIENTIGYNFGTSSRDNGNYYANILEDKHLVTVEEFLYICATTGMLPKFSVRYDVNWNTFKTLLIRFGFYGNGKCTLVHNSTFYRIIRENALPVLGDNVRYCIEYTSGSETMDIALTQATALGNVPILIEPVSKATWTQEEVDTIVNAGYIPSAAPDFTTFNKYEEFIKLGIREFTVNEIANVCIGV